MVIFDSTSMAITFQMLELQKKKKKKMVYTLRNFRRLTLPTNSSFTCHSFLGYLEAPPNIDILLKFIKFIVYTHFFS